MITPPVVYRAKQDVADAAGQPIRLFQDWQDTLRVLALLCSGQGPISVMYCVASSKSYISYAAGIGEPPLQTRGDHEELG